MSRCEATSTRVLCRSAVAAGLLFVTASCGKGDDDSSNDGSATAGMTAEECGDIDGNGGDSGDVPNILGAWNASFASIVYDGGCSVPGLGADDMRAMPTPSVHRVPRSVISNGLLAARAICRWLASAELTDLGSNLSQRKSSPDAPACRPWRTAALPPAASGKLLTPTHEMLAVVTI